MADRLDAAGVVWVATGSVGRVLTGGAARPGDLDLEVDRASIDVAAAALGLEAGLADDGPVRSLRAVGRLNGVEVDVSADLCVRGVRGTLPADFDLMRSWSTAVVVEGRTVLAAPVEEALCRALVLEAWGRLGRIAASAPPRVEPAYLAVRLASLSSSANR